MCRLFGLLGGPATPAEPWLVSTDRSLLAQAHATEEEAQRDGWGVAWYDARTKAPRLEKGIGGAYEPGEVERFRSAAHRAKGPVIFGHLRKASNPLNLPHDRLIARENSQPFVYGGYVFAHNGMIPYPREARTRLGRFESHVEGVNDSEILFWLLVHHTELTGDPLTAYGRSVDELEAIWASKGSPQSGPYSGLNVLFTRGPNELWAFCLSRGDHGGGLLDKNRPYYEMAYRADAKQIIVGSEPLDSATSEWRSIPDGTFLHAQASHGLVAITSGVIPRAALAPRARAA